MFTPRQISPLLDGFAVGQSISSRDGVHCCPAMREATEEKYILKIISVPADQSKLDALLLAGAFADADAARDYFKELAEDAVEEALLLQKLSRLEGFVGYESWQIAAMEEGTGFEVYLLAPYRPTLEKYMQRNPMTHLSAVNLGLDLCSALAACRREGYVFTDLKPGNIHLCENGEYRIGDLGFVRKDSLPYCSLPDKYRSPYTPPEIADAYSSLNDTLDIFALGLVLYQVYNGGRLPFEDAMTEPLPAPEYADYEMAEVILKACDPDPANRWQDPTEMGQALVHYMQRNGVNDTPIIPPMIPLSEESDDDDYEDEDDIVAVPVAMPEETAEAQVPAPEEAEVDGSEEAAEETAETQSEQTEPASEDEEISQWVQLSLEDSEEDAVISMEDMEAAPVSDEVSAMLAQADDLITHEIPEGVVAPEPVDVPIPPRIVLPEDPEEAPNAEEAENAGESEETQASAPAGEAEVDATLEDDQTQPVTVPDVAPEGDADVPATDAQEDAAEEDAAEEEEDEPVPVPLIIPNESPKKKRRWGLWIGLLIAVLLIVGGWLFYRNHVMQTILSIQLTGNEDRLTVSLNTEAPDAWLTVACTDPHGNTQRSAVKNGVAKFTGLKAKTRYTVTVEISGFHILIGKTTDSYVTADETTITSFTAVAGSEAGSVVLSFALEGPKTNQWAITYYAKGEVEKTVTFTGTMVNISDLCVGKTYTFLLEPVADLYVVGQDSLEFTVTRILYPENLKVQSILNNAMTVVWDTPAGETVESWDVHCYNSMGYDKTITVSKNSAVFEDLDTTTPYTIEVNVTGVSTFSRISVSANPITLTQLNVDGSSPTGPVVTWEFDGNAPAGGWLVLYTVTGLDGQLVVKTNEPTASLPPLVPGAAYTITIQTTAGNDVLGGETTWNAPSAQSFTGYQVSAQDIKCEMCVTPDKSSWTYKDVKKYTTTFKSGESASFTLTLDKAYDSSSDKILVLYLVRDSDGKIVSSATQTTTWNSLWKSGRGKLTLPAVPETAGRYTVSVYFNGGLLTEQAFTMQ